MFRLDLFKVDPIAYVLIAAILVLQVYSTFLRSPDADDILRRSDTAYKAAVFDDPGNAGMLQQIFRQNEIDRELLKATLSACSR